MSDIDEDITARIHLYPENSETKALRQLAYGVSPFILLEVDLAEDGEGVVFAVTGSLINDLPELVETMEGFLEVTKAAIAQQEASEEANGG